MTLFSLYSRKYMRSWLVVVLLCAVLFPAIALAAGDIQVEATLQPEKFSEDQAARFIVTVTGARSAEPDMPAAQGLHFIYQGQSSQTSWVNGKISSSISYTFLVQADKAGDFTIAPVKVHVDGTTYTSEPVQCTVLPAQSSGQVGNSSSRASTTTVPPGANEVNNIGFLRIMPKTERMYSGQMVPFALKAYFTPGRRVTLKSAPRLTGENFLLQSLDEEPLQQKKQVNGTIYTALTWQGTLSAVKEGNFPLTVEMDAEVLVRSKSRLQGTPFGSSLLDDPFFSGILGNYSRRDVTLTSQEQEMTVLDLPTENRPDTFSGAIGTFSLAVAASPLDGKVGDPVTVKMQLEGKGNFALVQAPVLSEKKGWKVYPASGTVRDLGAGKGMKTFEQALIPKEQGITALPSMRFSYFDPQAEEYVTLSSDPIPLSLETAPDQPVGQLTHQTEQKQASAAQINQQQNGKENKNISGKTSTSQPAQHLAPLHPDIGKLVPAIQPLYQKVWFQLLMVLALLCLFIAVVLS
ncbi:MAG: protein BatD, partial [Candidatus Electrothrix sp. MAN1_4]|nr:protein BatD [Candidatus Electrothrix sp. MAN1_4]